jgi:hypothetical protein
LPLLVLLAGPGSIAAVDLVAFSYPGMGSQSLVFHTREITQAELTTGPIPAEVLIQPPDGTDAQKMFPFERVYLSVAAKNTGNTAAAAFSVKVYLDEFELTTYRFSAGAAANQSVFVRNIWFWVGSDAVGDHTIKAVLDSGNEVGESSETNNTITRAIKILEDPNAKADLAGVTPNGWAGPLVVSTSPGTHTNANAATLVAGQNLFLDFAFENRGTKAITQPFGVALYLVEADGAETLLHRITPPELDLAYYGAWRYDEDVPLHLDDPGTYKLAVVLDTGATVAEKDETNNRFEKTITILANPAAPKRIYVKADAAGTANGGSWANAFTSVSGGLYAARSGDEVWVAAGTYAETAEMKGHVGLYGGFAGTETELFERDLRTGGRATVLVAPTATVQTALKPTLNLWWTREAVVDGLSLTHAVGAAAEVGPGVSAERVLDSELRNCRIYGNGGPATLAGGGLKLVRSALTLTDCVINGNTAKTGGALHSSADSGSITLRQCVIHDNTAEQAAGVHFGATSNQAAPLSVLGCTIVGNQATAAAGLGGAVHAEAGSGSLLVENSIVARNKPYGITEAALGQATLRACLFYGNGDGTTSGATNSTPTRPRSTAGCPAPVVT